MPVVVSRPSEEGIGHPKPDELRQELNDDTLEDIKQPEEWPHGFGMAFNEALVQALQLHKEYWTANEERQETSDGDIPLDVLALTCLAHDAGRPIDVESEYLPEHLLKRSWLGEFPT